MALRKRISVAAAAAAAIALLVAVLACYAILSSQLRGQVDNQLRHQATEILASTSTELGETLPSSPTNGGSAEWVQIVQSGQPVLVSTDGLPFKVNTILPDVNQARAVADGTLPSQIATVSVNGQAVRMYTFQYRISTESSMVYVAIQLGRSLTSVDSILGTMRAILVVLLLLGVGLAALLGRLAVRRVLTPLADVTATAQLIGETDDLTRRIDVQQDDEVGQLATRFNEMLERLSKSRQALDASVTAQRQLVADASHELRTPVTSLRTNVEVLLEDMVLDEEDRKRLLADVVEQSEELTALVADLIEVARGDLPEESMEDTRLDVLVEEALHRARRNNSSVEFKAQMQPVALHGHSERLSRAINNLLDNAAKHNHPGQPVEVTVTPSALAVRDHGSGIAPEDIPYVFDRFFRGINSRSRQGSGLGLAIVRQVTEQHGGTVAAANSATGGAIFTMRLPGTAVDPSQDDDQELFDDADSSAMSDHATVASHAKPSSQ